jgi:hypothetical protein
MEIEGKVLQLLPVQNINTQKGPLKKLEFVIEIEAKFPKKVCFSLWNDKVDLFNAKPGDIIKVFFDLESREYNGKWYTEAKAWKVENGQTAGIAEQNNFSSAILDDIPSTFNAQKEDIDDLPF